MILLFPLLAAVAADFESNLRNAITGDHIQGFMMMSLLAKKTKSQIIFECKDLLGDHSPPDNRVRELFTVANLCGIEAQPAKTTWRDERLRVASHHLQEYRKDNSILNRVIAIDELTVINGKLELIAASMKFRFVHYAFVKDRKAQTHDILTFLSDLSDKEATGLFKDPVLLWDNINIHKSTEVTNFIVNKGWEVWSQPRDSEDMNPLDYADFKQLKAEYKTSIPDSATVDDVMQIVTNAMIKIGGEGSLRGITLLPDVWEGVEKSDGLSAAPQSSLREKRDLHAMFCSSLNSTSEC